MDEENCDGKELRQVVALVYCLFISVLRVADSGF